MSEPVGSDTRPGRGRASARPIVAVLLLALAAMLVVGTAPGAAGADIVIPSPIGPIDLPLPDPLPDPTTTTTVPDPTTTTTAPDPTTTTTAAPPTTTTTAPRATTTTTRRTTTTTRRSTTTTAVARGGGAASSGKQSSGPTRPGATTGSPRRTSVSSRARTRASTPSPFQAFAPGPSGATVAPVADGATPDPLVPDRLRSAVAPATVPSGRAQGFDGSALAGVVLAGVTALVLALAHRDAARQRRSQATLIAPGTLRLGRDESEASVREQLQLMLAGGALTVTGSDCRSLQLLVQAAAHEGLEVRDPRGYIVRATNRLVRAYGVEPDRKRLPLRWAVGVGSPTVEVPDGYRFVLTRTGPDREGRLLAFTPGTEMVLWSGDCL